VGLVGAPVQRRATDLGEPDRLAARLPVRRHLRAHAADALVMRPSPPVAQILVTPDPGLAMRAIRDRAADLGSAMLLAGVIPVEALTPLDIGHQIGRVVDVAPIPRIQVILALAP